MKHARTIFAALLLSALCLAAADKAAALSLTCTVPKDDPSFKEALVTATLWEYDPLLADAAAKPVAKVELKDATHEQGKETTFKLGLATKFDPKRKYYVTVFIYPNNQVDDTKRLYFIDGFQKVFEKRAEDKVAISLKRVQR